MDGSEPEVAGEPNVCRAPAQGDPQVGLLTSCLIVWHATKQQVKTLNFAPAFQSIHVNLGWAGNASQLEGAQIHFPRGKSLQRLRGCSIEKSVSSGFAAQLFSEFGSPISSTFFLLSFPGERRRYRGREGSSPPAASPTYVPAHPTRATLQHTFKSYQVLRDEIPYVDSSKK